MRSRLLVIFAVITIILIVFLIIRIEALLKDQQRCWADYYSCVDTKSETIANYQILTEWNLTQHELWFSNFRDFGSIYPQASELSSQLDYLLSDKLIYWFSNENACRDCVNNDINLLKSIADSIGFNQSFLVRINDSGDFEIDHSTSESNLF